MEFSRWWTKDSKESYWLEITDRDDLGVDLNAPQKNDEKMEYYGYSLIKEIKPQDIIFHYHKEQKAVTMASIASGEVWEDQVVWGAHGTTARGANIQPYPREGWRHGLLGAYPLAPYVTLQELREKQNEIKLVRSHLEQKYSASLYFPFELSEKRDLRPTQAYLTKFPADVVALFPVLSTVSDLMKGIAIPTSSHIQKRYLNELGTTYRSADENILVANREPFPTDPELIERGTREHARTQNYLAHYLTTIGIVPLSPKPNEPNYDMAWSVGEEIYVAEVKSITQENEEKQLRLGLGQVLRYGYTLRKFGKNVVPLLMIERIPSDKDWIDLCQEVGVRLIWPEILATVIHG